MEIVNLTLLALLASGCAASASADDLERRGLDGNACRQGPTATWIFPAWAVTSTGTKLVVQRGKWIELVQPRTNESLWRWMIHRTMDTRGSEGLTGFSLGYTIDKKPAKILGVVQNHVVFSDDNAFAGVIDHVSGETVLRFGGYRQYEVHHDTATIRENGVAYSASDEAVTAVGEAGREVIPGAQLLACGEDSRHVLLQPDGRAVALGAPGGASIGSWRPGDTPHAFYLEGGALHQITGQDELLRDTAGTCWESPLAIRKVVLTTEGVAVLTEPAHAKQGPLLYFYEFDTKREIAPCRRVTATPRLVDVRPEPGQVPTRSR